MWIAAETLDAWVKRLHAEGSGHYTAAEDTRPSSFRGRLSTMPPLERGTLYPNPADDGPLDNAAATCFVENVAGEPCDRELSPHLTGEARRYWQHWGGRAAPGAADRDGR